jgi:formamidopyrimidine-DNA glycosylase
VGHAETDKTGNGNSSGTEYSAVGRNKTGKGLGELAIMPELPEVQTMVDDIRPLITGLHIENIEFLWKNTLQYPSPEEFNKSIKGRKIESVARRGKYIIIHLDDRDKNDKLLLHMRMTGSLFWSHSEDLPRFTRTIIRFKEGGVLYFLDPRKFGKVMLGNCCPEIEKLGIEPLEDEFNAEYLGKLLKDKSTAIKTLLLDQSMIAGVGNMYADEALYKSKIDPERKAGSLTAKETKLLCKSIKEVLEAGIKAGGASVHDYFRPDGKKGNAQEAYKVAHNKDGICEICGGRIHRKVVGQRGTYFCPNCQK